MTEAARYAEALFLLSEEEGCLDTVLSDLGAVATAVKDNPDYTKILDTPSLSKEERLGLCDTAFSGLCEYVLNTVKILTEKRQMRYFSRLYDAFLALYNKKMGIIPVEAITAVELTEEQCERLKKKLEEKLSATVLIKNTVDKSILGGIMLRYDSIQLDGSVKSRLDKIEAGLKQVVI